MRSVMVHQFSQVPSAQIPRSSFDRSHGYKTTFNAGLLYPVFVDEVLPGDTFRVSMTALARLSTPLKPVMDNLFLNSFFFFVPYRLIWDNWERFNGAQPTPGATTDFLVPQVVAGPTGFGVNSIYDYFGLPPTVANLSVSALPCRAYNLIYNEWFRDQNLQNPALVNTTDGPDDPAWYTLARRGKRHDYFTSALPWPQKGESVSIPLGTVAPVIGAGDPLPTFRVGGAGTNLGVASGSPNVIWGTGTEQGGLRWVNPALEADLSEATAATINQLRQAFQVQRLYERDARGGTRYTEIVRSHFGVISPDARLQRPEYLGGGQAPIIMHAVPQTSEEGGKTPQANLAAYGTATPHGHGFSRSFTEHGVIIGLISVRADLTYQQGINRMWSRRQRFDFYWPALSHLGEQAVLNKEIWADGTAADEAVFGYQERYAEYRYKPSQLTSLMRSDAPGSVDIWHLSQDFSTRPVLNASFIIDNPPIERIVAVPSEPHFIGDFYFQMRCARPMPVYGVPGLIDHF